MINLQTVCTLSDAFVSSSGDNLPSFGGSEMFSLWFLPLEWFVECSSAQKGKIFIVAPLLLKRISSDRLPGELSKNLQESSPALLLKEKNARLQCKVYIVNHNGRLIA